MGIILYLMSIVLMLVIFVQVTSGLLTAIIGKDFVSFTNRSYTKRPSSTFDKILNIAFFTFHGIPDFFYKMFMRRTTYWKARLFFLLWLAVFITFCILVFFLIGYFVENILGMS
jgi:hypothetical protein